MCIGVSKSLTRSAAEDPTVQRDVPTHSTPFLQRNTRDGDPTAADSGCYGADRSDRRFVLRAR
jgi:hypothetical protein